jgi:DNA-binding response OmpR family regulator
MYSAAGTRMTARLQIDDDARSRHVKVLVVEDDPGILRTVADNLRFERYEVFTATDGETAYALHQKEQPDLIVLDLMLPRMSGLDLCRKLRTEDVQVPVLMLTARGQEADRVRGLDLGGDDYVTKPFSVPELMARVRALLRRSAATPGVPDTLKFGQAEIDFERYAAQVVGRPVEMTRKEFALLRFLASHKNAVVTRDEILNKVWGLEAYPVTRTVDNHIASLRAKLETNPAEPAHIQTVHGVGYKFVPDADQ